MRYAQRRLGLRRAGRFLLFLLFFSLLLGFVVLWMSARSYAPLPAGKLFLFYLRHPLLVLLNLLPMMLLAALGFFLFSRAWAATLFAALPALALLVCSYFKLLLRSEPVFFSDLALVRTAGGFAGRYHLLPTAWMCGAAVVALCLTLLALLLPRCRLTLCQRLIGSLVCLALLVGGTATLYASDDLYDSFPCYGTVDPWDTRVRYLSHGTVYSFLHSAPRLLRFGEGGGRTLYESYTDADIPAEQRVTVLGIMAEAFSDLSELAPLRDNERVAEIYAPLHALEAESISGQLVTNIFAGGTVDTEWCALTGLSSYEAFSSATGSYVRYFASQGYETRYQHPGYGWYYDREHINAYLGFQESVFSENGFAELVDPVYAQWHSDGIVVDYLLRQLDGRGADDPPLFSFTVTYQNHGPYEWEQAIFPDFFGKNPGWSKATYCILANYLHGISETLTELTRLVDSLRGRDEPIVLVFFGDHKPWLGDGNSAYNEVGVNLNTATQEGFVDFYATPYLIWANDAAKAALGASFTGEGGLISPCFLMTELFDACSWEGPGFMQLSREMRAISPVLARQPVFLQDGALTGKLSADDMRFYTRYRSAQEFWQRSEE